MYFRQIARCNFFFSCKYNHLIHQPLYQVRNEPVLSNGVDELQFVFVFFLYCFLPLDVVWNDNKRRIEGKGYQSEKVFFLDRRFLYPVE